MFRKNPLAAIIAVLCLCMPSPAATGIAAIPTPDPAKLQLDSSFTAWETPSKPRAMILSIHGFGLHKGAFAAFAHRMVKEGIAVYAIDVRGFGSWTDPRVKYQKVDFYSTLIDVGTLLPWLSKIHPGVPTFLLGESMGGAIAVQATAMFPDNVHGLIASVPGNEYFRANQTNMDVVLHLVRPDTPFDISEQVVERATDKKELKSSWRKDPKSRLTLSPLELFEFHQFMKKSHELARRIDHTPVLMLHGVQDKLAKPDGTFKIFNELATKDKDLMMISGSEHLIFEDAQFNEPVIDVVLNWIGKHIRI